MQGGRGWGVGESGVGCGVVLASAQEADPPTPCRTSTPSTDSSHCLPPLLPLPSSLPSLPSFPPLAQTVRGFWFCSLYLFSGSNVLIPAGLPPSLPPFIHPSSQPPSPAFSVPPPLPPSLTRFSVHPLSSLPPASPAHGGLSWHECNGIKDGTSGG